MPGELGEGIELSELLQLIELRSVLRRRCPRGVDGEMRMHSFRLSNAWVENNEFGNGDDYVCRKTQKHMHNGINTESGSQTKMMLALQSQSIAIEKSLIISVACK